MLRSLSPNTRGIAAMVLACIVFTINDTLVKVARQIMPTGEILFVRGLFALAGCAVLVVAMGEAKRIGYARHPMVMLRATAELMTAIFFVAALALLPLAQLTAVTQAAPLIIAVYCAITGIAPMGPRRWAAMLIGFGGVLLVVRPGGSVEWPILFAIASALCVAMRDLSTRKVPPHITSTVVLCATCVLVTTGGLVLGLGETWVAPSPLTIGLLAISGFFVTAGHFFTIVAYRGSDVTAVAPFRYTVLIWAALGGYLAFGEVPDAWTLVGAALIAGSSAYTIHRERVAAAATRIPAGA